MNRAAVYHIRRPGMNLNEGYIGVSVNPKDRLKQHEVSSYPVGNAIRAHADVRMDILVWADEAYCYKLENELRPVERVGWNLAIGGNRPPRVTPEATLKMSNTIRGRTKENNRGRLSQSIKLSKLWKNPTEAMLKGKEVIRGENHFSKLAKHQRTCEHCDRTMFVSNHTKWHGDKCKARN